jgi:hypothetical protein
MRARLEERGATWQNRCEHGRAVDFRQNVYLCDRRFSFFTFCAIAALLQLLRCCVAYSSEAAISNASSCFCSADIIFRVRAKNLPFANEMKKHIWSIFTARRLTF